MVFITPTTTMIAKKLAPTGCLILAALSIFASASKTSLLDNKAPMLSSALDGLFSKIKTMDDPAQQAFRNHMLASFEHPNSIIIKKLAECSSRPAIDNKIKVLKKVMGNTKMSDTQKTEYMRKWLRVRLNVCAMKVSHKDLLTMMTELAKAKIEAELYSARLTDEQRAEYDAVKLNATARYALYKDETATMVDEMMATYRDEVPDDYRHRIDALAGDLKDELETKWESEWKQALKDKWENEYKQQLLEKINEKVPETAQDLFDWLLETVEDEVDNRDF